MCETSGRLGVVVMCETVVGWVWSLCVRQWLAGCGRYV